MCTVSWTHGGNGYELLCNRDERKTRLRALPPEVRARDGVRYLAPIDADFGGTWIAVNEFGFSVCLLNGTAARGRPIFSRGLATLRLATSLDAEDAGCCLASMVLDPFAPFTMALIDPRGARVFEWDGTRRALTPSLRPGLPHMLTSSSFKMESVRAARAREFDNRRSLFDFHSSHAPAPGPYSVCMHRDDAETVSFSRIRAGAGGIDFFYSPGAPCRHAPAQHGTLAIRS